MLDRFDRVILHALVADGRTTQSELGLAANLSGTAAARRQKIMEERGVITGYRAELNLAVLGIKTTVMVLIQLERQSSDAFDAFERAVIQCPSVLNCHLVSGGEDYLITLCARDLSDFERIHRDELSKLPGVSRMQSFFSLREVVTRFAPPSLFQ